MKLMRTIVDIPDTLIAALSSLSRRRKISRAEAIRQAVARYLEQETTPDLVEAFGVWRGRRAGGLAYEDAVRGEWEGPRPKRKRARAST
jgi:hypothetical protein